MSTTALLNHFITSDMVNLSIFEIVLAIILPFILCLFCGLFYRWTSKTHQYNIEFVYSFILFSSLTSMMTLVIGQNLARAFGLVAALSLIRFRTAIKSPMDGMYLFWSLTIGLSCGTGFYLAAILITFLGMGLLFLLYFFRFGEGRKTNVVLKVFTSLHGGNEKWSRDFEFLAEKHLKHLQRINVLFNSEEDRKIYVYSADIDQKEDLTKVQNKLSSVPGCERVELLNTQTALFT